MEGGVDQERGRCGSSGRTMRFVQVQEGGRRGGGNEKLNYVIYKCVQEIKKGRGTNKIKGVCLDDCILI